MYVWRQEWSPTNNKRGGHPAVQAFHTPMNMTDRIFQQYFRFTHLFTPTSVRRTPPCLQSLCPSAVSAVSVVSAVSAVSVVSVCFLKKQSAMLCLSGFAHRGCPGIWMIPPQTILKRCLNWHHWKCGNFRKLPVKNYFPFPDIMNCLGEWRTPATHFYSQFSPPGIYINPTSSQTTPNMAKYESNPKRWNETKPIGIYWYS